MKNYVMDGDVVTIAAPYDLANGEAVQVGSVFGVASKAAKLGEQVDLATVGVFDLVAESTQSYLPGTDLFWDVANKRITNVSGAGSCVAVCITPKAAGEAVVRGKLTLATLSAVRGVSALVGAQAVVPMTAVDSSAIITYAQCIAAIDANLSGVQGVTKTDRGACANGVDRLFEYRAGTGPINVLIVSGQHGPELKGCWAMMRWFKEFAAPTKGVFAALNQMITVSWVPSGNPGAFRTGRKNPNDVDLNRNWPFYWSRYTPPNTDNNKGSAALSEPETQALKSIIDARGVDAVIDCHNYEAGFSTYEILTAPGSIYTRANRRLWVTATQLFNKLFSANSWGFGVTGGRLSDAGNLADANPTFANWAQHYIHNTLDRPHGASVLIECSEDLRGSNFYNMTADAVTVYAGYITTWLLTFLGSIGATPALPAHAWQQRRFNEATGTSIVSGGTLLDSAADAVFSWDETEPNAGSVPRSYVDCPVVCAGYLDVVCDGTIESQGTAASRYSIGITLDGGAVINSRNQSVTVGATAGDRYPWSVTARIPVTTVDAAYVPRIAMTVNRISGTGGHTMKRARITVRFVPEDMRVSNRTPVF